MSLHHLAPAVARIACSDRTHTLLWRDGALHTPDHPDPEAERALASLGGAPCRCVELLDAWAGCAADPRVLVLGPRGSEAAPPLGHDDGPGIRPVRAKSLRPGSAVMYRRSGSAPGATTETTDPILDCLALGGALPHRLVACAASVLAGRVQEPTLAAQLYAALYGRLLVSLGHWLGELPELELAMIEAGEPPTLTATGGGVAARIPFHWLIDVWAAGLDTVAGRFTLAADFDPASGGELLTIDQTIAVNACKIVVQ